MFDFKEISKLVELVQSNDIDELEVSRLFGRVKIRRRSAEVTSEPVGRSVRVEEIAPAPPAPPAAEVPEEEPRREAEENLVAIRSPMVGTFYASPAADAPAFTDVGKTVEAGQVVCIIEAMKLMNEIESEVEGTIVEVRARNAQPVQYDETLFLLRPS